MRPDISGAESGVVSSRTVYAQVLRESREVRGRRGAIQKGLLKGQCVLPLEGEWALAQRSSRKGGSLADGSCVSPV